MPSMEPEVNRYIAMLEAIRSPPPTAGPLGFGMIESHNTFHHFLSMREQDWPEQVTYYCSGQVASSIVGNGFLWMCDVRNMNDESEFLFASRLFDDELRRLRLQGIVPDGLLNALADSKREFVASANDAVFNDKLVLAMCTSALPDDAAMWDRYGEAGEGVGIRFHLPKLATAVSTASHFVPNSNRFDTGIVKVCYPDPACGCLKQMAANSLAAYSQVKTPDERDLIRVLLHADVLEYLARHKHPSFVSEREFRIYSRAPSRQTWVGSNHIHEHMSGSRTIKHAKVFLPHLAINESQEDFWQALIPSVTFGPSCSESTREEIEAILETRGLAGRSMKSTCPLRRP